MENIHWISALDYLAKHDLNLYAHNKVAFLVNTHTMEHRITNNWSDPDHDTTYLTIDTPSDGEILLVNAYIPNGVDNMAQQGYQLKNVEDQYKHILDNVLNHEGSIVCMDVNETGEEFPGVARWGEVQWLCQLQFYKSGFVVSLGGVSPALNIRDIVTAD